MKPAAVRNLKRKLSEAGLYDGAINGSRDAELDRVAARFVSGRRADLSGDSTNWSAKRNTVAAYQLFLADDNLPVGDIDGLWGPNTDNAHVAHEETLSFGAPVLFRDAQPPAANPNAFPASDDERALEAIYGPHGVKGGFTPPSRIVTCPWKLKLSWDLSSTTRRISCHERVADRSVAISASVATGYRATSGWLTVCNVCWSPCTRSTARATSTG